MGVTLRRLREERGLSREDLASLSGISVSSIQKIEIGPVVEPGYFTIVALCQALEVNLADINAESMA